MKLTEHKILIATFDANEIVGDKRFIAQSNDYPVRNGSGNTIDEAMEDLFLEILVHLHNKRTGRT